MHMLHTAKLMLLFFCAMLYVGILLVITKVIHSRWGDIISATLDMHLA